MKLVADRARHSHFRVRILNVTHSGLHVVRDPLGEVGEVLILDNTELLVNVLLVVGDQRLEESLSDGVDLKHVTTSLQTADIGVSEPGINFENSNSIYQYLYFITYFVFSSKPPVKKDFGDLSC